MTYCSWPRLAQIYRALAQGEVKLIGWGAGAQMRRHYLTGPYPLSYVIDSRPALWGQRFLGREVRPPEALLDEDPARVVVLVGPTRSHRSAIGAQIAALGPYEAITPYSAELAERFCMTLQRVEAADLAGKPVATGANGIVVQGPYDPAGTPTLLRILATHYPHDWIVWSTWRDTPPDVLTAMGAWCDGVVLSHPPAHPGNGNCNLQRRTTLAGLAWLREQGVRLALKTRSDGAPLARNLFLRADALYASLPPPPPAAGLKRRIVVSNAFTMMHIPLHISDIVQMGEVSDLETLWSFPEDDSPLRDLGDVDIQSLPVANYARANLIGEIRIGHQLAHMAGMEVDYSLEQYLELVRDSLIVIDHPWFDLFVPKYHPTNQSLCVRTAEHPKDLIDFETWMGLQARDPDFVRSVIGGFDAERTSQLDLYSGSLATKQG